MRARHIALIGAGFASVASSGDVVVVEDREDIAWDSDSSWTQDVSLREGQSETLRVNLMVEGQPEASLFVDVWVQDLRGEPWLDSQIGWPGLATEGSQPLTASSWVTLELEDVARGCREIEDTGFAAPAEMSGGLCRTWVELTLTLQGEGNAVLQVNPSVSTPWETEGAAWIESVETL